MNKPDPIPARLAALKTTPTPDLKAQWRDLFETEPPPFNRRFLESRLAYRIQELVYGGLKPDTIRRLEALGTRIVFVLSSFWQTPLTSKCMSGYVKNIRIFNVLRITHQVDAVMRSGEYQP